MGFPEPLKMRPSMSSDTGVFKTCRTKYSIRQTIITKYSHKPRRLKVDRSDAVKRNHTNEWMYAYYFVYVWEESLREKSELNTF